MQKMMNGLRNNLSNMKNTFLPSRNNFAKVDNITSSLKFGNYIEDADLTICIPIFGIGKYLIETLNSVVMVLNNTNLKLQVIISNNSSNELDDERIKSIVSAFGLDCFIYFNTTKPLGMFNNFNRCIQLAHTEYIAFLHDDDLLIPNFGDYITRALNVLKNNKKIGMIHENYEVFYQNPILKEVNDFSFYELSDSLITTRGNPNAGIPSCGMVISKEAAVKCGGFNSDYPCLGDSFLSISLRQFGFEILQVNEIVGFYRLAVNTSMKLDVCLGFIKEGILFRDYWYSQNVFRKLYYLFMKRYLYCKDIDFRTNWFSKLNPDINENSLDFLHLYRRYRKGIHYFVFKFFNKIFRKKARKY